MHEYDKNRDLTKAVLGIAAMFGVYWLYTFFLSHFLRISGFLKNVLGLGVLYIVGLGIFLYINKDVPKVKYEKRPVSTGTLITCLMLQFTALIIVALLVTLNLSLGGDAVPMEDFALSPYVLFMLLLFAPVMEEVVFRHLLAQNLLKHGERFFLLVSAYCFAIIHGVSLGWPQIIYTFILGLIWAYLIIKTGNLLLAIVFHALSNFFGNIITQILVEISQLYLGIYTIVIVIFAIVGIVLFFRNRKNIVLDGTPGIMDKAVIIEILKNPAIIFFTLLTLITMTLK